MQVDKDLNEEAASEDASANRNSFVVTHVDDAVFSSAGDLLLYTEAVPKHTRPKQNGSVNGCNFY